MIAMDQIPRLYGLNVTDSNGAKIGTLGSLWTDETGRPTWASVRTGFFGTNESLVPLHAAEVERDQVRVPYDKDTVKDAPNIDASADEPLQGDDVTRLYEHYHLSAEETVEQTGAQTGGRYGTEVTDEPMATRGTTGYDTSGPTTDDAMTRSEERLNVGTRVQEAGRARLRKYIVTEQVQTTVPVSHEEARIEREPITEANVDQAMKGPELSEEEHEVTLHAEKPVVAKETVPVERVRLDTETVTDEQAVSEEVRKERIETDLPDRDKRNR